LVSKVVGRSSFSLSTRSRVIQNPLEKAYDKTNVAGTGGYPFQRKIQHKPESLKGLLLAPEG
jgi:hypothetical protein